jgi:hypothetical protein
MKKKRGVPDAAIIEVVVPASTVPASAMSASTVPSSTIPSSTAPASTAPASTAPASTAPASTAPASAVSAAVDTPATVDAPVPAAVDAPAPTAVAAAVPVTVDRRGRARGRTGAMRGRRFAIVRRGAFRDGGRAVRHNRKGGRQLLCGHAVVWGRGSAKRGGTGKRLVRDECE